MFREIKIEKSSKNPEKTMFQTFVLVKNLYLKHGNAEYFSKKFWQKKMCCNIHPHPSYSPPVGGRTIQRAWLLSPLGEPEG
jgi:hypothetical protein